MITVLHRDANVDGDDGHDDVENKRGESARELPLFTVLSGFSANGVEFTDLLLRNRERLTWKKSLTIATDQHHRHTCKHHCSL